MKIEKGEYYLIKCNKFKDYLFIKIIDTTPNGIFLVNIENKRKWMDIDSGWDRFQQENDYYVVEHLSNEYVQKLFREEKLNKILEDDK